MAVYNPPERSFISIFPPEFDISKIDVSAPKKPFYETLLSRQGNKKNSIIAEIKKRSPSKGMLDSNLNVSEKAVQYEAGGASCLSVLTEKDYFHGSIDDLLIAKKSVNLPILRKDFIIDELQVYQSKMIGADCILLIASALSHKLFEELYSLAASLNLDVLAEIHDIDELDFVKSLGIKLLGINNRNLKTFNVDIETSVRLSSKIPSNYAKISESGISNSNDIITLKNFGYDGFLIGENFMKSDHPGNTAKDFIKKITQ